jgi:hypothetical protein
VPRGLRVLTIAEVAPLSRLRFIPRWPIELYCGRVDAAPTRADLRAMEVEFLDAYGRWQQLSNATAERAGPGAYEVTIVELSPAWGMRAEMFDGALLRVDGRETSTVVGTRTEADRIFLRAETEPSHPSSTKP